MRDARVERYKTAGIRGGEAGTIEDRGDSRHGRCKTGRMQDRRDEGG